MIYFIGAKGVDLIKIGFTCRNPCVRFAALQVGSPVALIKLALMAGDKRREQAIHKRYREFHSHGEWFRSSEYICNYIQAKAEPWPECIDDRFLLPRELKAIKEARAAQEVEIMAAVKLIRPDSEAITASAPPEEKPKAPDRSIVRAYRESKRLHKRSG